MLCRRSTFRDEELIFAFSCVFSSNLPKLDRFNRCKWPRAAFFFSSSLFTREERCPKFTASCLKSELISCSLIIDASCVSKYNHRQKEGASGKEKVLFTIHANPIYERKGDENYYSPTNSQPSEADSTIKPCEALKSKIAMNILIFSKELSFFSF